MTDRNRGGQSGDGGGGHGKKKKMVDEEISGVVY